MKPLEIAQWAAIALLLLALLLLKTGIVRVEKVRVQCDGPPDAPVNCRPL